LEWKFVWVVDLIFTCCLDANYYQLRAVETVEHTVLDRIWMLVLEDCLSLRTLKAGLPWFPMIEEEVLLHHLELGEDMVSELPDQDLGLGIEICHL